MTDGGYSQSAKVAQPITVTDNLGHVTHLRYDSQGRTISVTDALGNETDFTYNIVGQADTTTFPPRVSSCRQQEQRSTPDNQACYLGLASLVTLLIPNRAA